MQRTQDNRPLGELFGDLARDVGTLFRQEVALAKAEVTHKAANVGKNGAMVAAGGAIAYAGFLAIVAAIILALALVVPAWAAALIVGVVVAGLGYFLVRRGLDSIQQEGLAPDQTIESLRENAEWAKRQVK
jgi:hypothetical protein